MKLRTHRHRREKKTRLVHRERIEQLTLYVQKARSPVLAELTYSEYWDPCSEPMLSGMWERSGLPCTNATSTPSANNTRCIIGFCKWLSLVKLLIQANNKQDRVQGVGWFHPPIGPNWYQNQNVDRSRSSKFVSMRCVALFWRWMFSVFFGSLFFKNKSCFDGCTPLSPFFWPLKSLKSTSLISFSLSSYLFLLCFTSPIPEYWIALALDGKNETRVKTATSNRLSRRCNKEVDTIDGLPCPFFSLPCCWPSPCLSLQPLRLVASGRLLKRWIRTMASMWT